jgi:hypothetical protein
MSPQPHENSIRLVPQPFAMLVEHGIDYVNKRLVAGKKAMPPVAKFPAFMDGTGRLRSAMT